MPGNSVTRVRVASSTTSKGITPSSSLIRAHAPNQLPPPDSCGFVYPHFFPAVLAGCCEPPAGNRFFPTLSPQFFPQMPGPQPRRSHRVHLPVSSSVSSAFPRPLSSRLLVSSAQTRFSAVRFRISYVQASEFACLPDRSHRCHFRRAAETSTSGQNVLRCLCTHRIWRRKDFHLSRFAPLSAAPGAHPHLSRRLFTRLFSS